MYDETLKIEAYHFEGIVQPFPNHFHEHYVIGFLENGCRHLSCASKEYRIESGNIVLFNPGDSHACIQTGDGALDYSALNISKEVMLDLAQEVSGKRELPRFSQNVIRDEEILCGLRSTHEMVMRKVQAFEKEESLLFLMSSLIRKYSGPFECHVPACRQEIEEVCLFLQRHYAQRIELNQLCAQVGLSKSTLLRSFTKAKGITPYRYLETIRINEAQKRLMKGESVLDAAIKTGFFDQSHFTNYFIRFTGLAPGAYRDMFFEKEKGGK